MNLPVFKASFATLRRLPATALLLAIISTLAAGCTTNAEWEQKLMKSGNVVLVSTDTFQSLRYGMTAAEVHSRCGGAGRFQFAVHFLNSDYLCVSYLVNTSDYTHNDEPYYVLFRDGVMWKTVDARQVDLPATASVLECGVAVARVMTERGTTPDELRSKFRKVLPPYPDSSTREYNIPVWLYLIILTVQWPHYEAMVCWNRSLEDWQNGFNVRVGMRPDQVEQIMGGPRYIDKTLGRKRPWKVCTYGKYAGLQRYQINSRQYEARPLTVIYLRDKAVAILGHDFVPQLPWE